MSLPSKQPLLAVDAVILLPGSGPDRIVLIERKNPPHGWALPGGMVDYGESVETAVVREVKEETGLDFTHFYQFHTYSEPSRDPRGHVVSIVFVGRATGVPVGADDAKKAGVFTWREVLGVSPIPLAFDHREILRDVYESFAAQPPF